MEFDPASSSAAPAATASSSSLQHTQTPPAAANSNIHKGPPSSPSSSGPRGNQPAHRRADSKNFSRGQRGGGRGGRTGKKRDLGRAEWAKQKGDKRQRNEDEQAAKRQRVDNGEKELPIYATKFSEEVLKEEERRPKKKVAVLIGYAGTGYKGMQLTHDQKTIEGDLFQAFVAAGAISKANADDPKKSSFVRCARTDKGVHAAGNVISLKLIVEDEDIVKKINDNLVPQIRVWGYERTNNSFSAYQMVDSRIYEYLIPTHSFLPPHPRSFLGRKCEEWANREGEHEEWMTRQEEVADYWDKVDEETIKPILEDYDEKTRDILEKALYLHADESTEGRKDDDELLKNADDDELVNGSTKMAQSLPKDQDLAGELPAPLNADLEEVNDKPTGSTAVTEAIKRLRQAYIAAKRAYRIPDQRLERIRNALKMYVGTKNYHNYTVAKTFKDPSSKRVIKSFVVGPKPILINGTEWLSLKVHGQSFMMHQIRKMVGMVALLVRCGCRLERMTDSFGQENFSIPKAPSLGLLLERPVFDSYNHKAKRELGKQDITFEKYKSEMDDFKQREIYERMYRDEEKDNVFGNFFNHIDNFPESTFLFVTSGGFQATKEAISTSRKSAENALAAVDVDGDSDGDTAVDDRNGDEG